PTRRMRTSDAGAARPIPCAVIGLGNPLMGDDGLGLAMLERLLDGWEVPDEVQLVDGGTWGMRLLPLIEDAERLLLLDAINLGLEPGTAIVLGREEIPRYLSVKLSPHQVDLRDTLAAAELRDTLPPEIVAIGLQPERVEMSVALSPVLERRLDDLMATVVRQLEAWGWACRRREAVACTR
ncbi:MAG TPA: HyaD/HybD family hydrogenase maturation endopeptidase, partial [Gemmatimonadaceae bacterium]|nr:HyaD/HybD family hydrogenase maturation endopeptidase [Gemmatimonadaceae bacterium]